MQPQIDEIAISIFARLSSKYCNFSYKITQDNQKTKNEMKKIRLLGMNNIFLLFGKYLNAI